MCLSFLINSHKFYNLQKFKLISSDQLKLFCSYWNTFILEQLLFWIWDSDEFVNVDQLLSDPINWKPVCRTVICIYSSSFSSYSLQRGRMGYDEIEQHRNWEIHFLERKISLKKPCLFVSKWLRVAIPQIKLESVHNLPIPTLFGHHVWRKGVKMSGRESRSKPLQTEYKCSAKQSPYLSLISPNVEEVRLGAPNAMD